MMLLFSLYFLLLASAATAITNDTVKDDDGGGSGDMEAVETVTEDNGEVKVDKDDDSASTIETLLRDPSVLHVKSKDLISGKMDKKLKTFAHLRSEVLQKQKIVTLDLTDTKGTPDEEKVKEHFFNAYAVYFPVDLVVVSHFDANIMFTTFEDIKHPRLPKSDMKKSVEEIFELHSQVNKTSTRNVAESGSGSANLPIIAFNWMTHDQIPQEMCRLGDRYRGDGDVNFHYSGKPVHNLCSDRAGVSIIYEVSVFRSLIPDNQAQGVVDEKMVRITTVDTTGQGRGSGGGGFTLSDSMHTYSDNFRDDNESGYAIKRKMTSLYATEYEIKIEAMDNRAVLKYSMPDVNEQTEVFTEYGSSQTVGVSAGISAAKEPSVDVSVSAEKTKSASVSFSTTDFSLARSAGNKYITYKYERDIERLPELPDQPDLDSDDFERVVGRINSIGFGFLPKFDVTFVARPDEEGITNFKLHTKVKAQAFVYHQKIPDSFAYRVYQWPVHHEMSHTFTNMMQVDWGHPIFTGYRPVNLIPAKLKPTRALQVRPRDGLVSLAKASLTNPAQGFIYSSSGTYESIVKRDFCLDADHIHKLQPCDAAQLNQKWEWEWKVEKQVPTQPKVYEEFLKTKEGEPRRLGVTGKDSEARLRVYGKKLINKKGKQKFMKIRTNFMDLFRPVSWGQDAGPVTSNTDPLTP